MFINNVCLRPNIVLQPFPTTRAKCMFNRAIKNKPKKHGTQVLRPCQHPRKQAFIFPHLLAMLLFPQKTSAQWPLRHKYTMKTLIKNQMKAYAIDGKEHSKDNVCFHQLRKHFKLQPQTKNTCFMLSPVVLFVHIDCFAVICRDFGDTGR